MDKLLADLNAHELEIYLKLVAIMKERLDFYCRFKKKSLQKKGKKKVSARNALITTAVCKKKSLCKKKNVSARNALITTAVLNVCLCA